MTISISSEVLKLINGQIKKSEFIELADVKCPKKKDKLIHNNKSELYLYLL